MKVAQFSKPGGPEVFEYVDAPDPKAGDGQALIQVKAIGVNYADVYNRSGLYPAAKLPSVPGTEAAGTVLQIGAGVTEVKVGDEVVFTGVPATYAEKVVAPAWRLVKLPAGMKLDLAVAGFLQGITAQYLCHSTYPVSQGETVLISDRNRVVAELVPPREHRSPLVADAQLADLIRTGLLTPALYPPSPPPRPMPAASLRELLSELDQDRGER